MVSLLLVKGANVKAKDRKERTPLHLAAYMGMMSACIVLVQCTCCIMGCITMLTCMQYLCDVRMSDI